METMLPTTPQPLEVEKMEDEQIADQNQLPTNDTLATADSCQPLTKEDLVSSSANSVSNPSDEAHTNTMTSPKQQETPPPERRSPRVVSVIQHLPKSAEEHSACCAYVVELREISEEFKLEGHEKYEIRQATHLYSDMPTHVELYWAKEARNVERMFKRQLETVEGLYAKYHRPAPVVVMQAGLKRRRDSRELSPAPALRIDSDADSIDREAPQPKKLQLPNPIVLPHPPITITLPKQPPTVITSKPSTPKPSTLSFSKLVPSNPLSNIKLSQIPISTPNSIADAIRAKLDKAFFSERASAPSSIEPETHSNRSSISLPQTEPVALPAQRIEPAVSKPVPYNHKCTVCSKGFTSINLLTTHLLTEHTGANSNGQSEGILTAPSRKNLPSTSQRHENLIVGALQTKIFNQINTGQKAVIICPHNNCKQEFNSVQTMMTHAKLMHWLPDRTTGKANRKRCEICVKAVLIDHIDEHIIQDHPNLDSLVQCPQCHQFFPNTGSLARHMLIHKGNNGNTITNFPEQFLVTGNSSAAELNTQEIRKPIVLTEPPMLINTPPPPPPLPTASEFIHSDNPPDVRAIFQQLPPYEAMEIKQETSNNELSPRDEKTIGIMTSCELCGESFSTMVEFKEHQKKHHVESQKRYGCTICDKTFTTLYNLKAHMGIHTGYKPYGCKYCGKTFLRKYDMQRHERHHTGDKPFTCNICGKQFIDRGSLKKHNRTSQCDLKLEQSNSQEQLSPNNLTYSNTPPSGQTSPPPMMAAQLPGHSAQTVADMDQIMAAVQKSLQQSKNLPIVTVSEQAKQISMQNKENLSAMTLEAIANGFLAARGLKTADMDTRENGLPSLDFSTKVNMGMGIGNLPGLNLQAGTQMDFGHTHNS